MKNIILLSFIVFIILGCNESPTYSKKTLLEDYDRFYEIIIHGHPKPFTNLDELEEVKNTQRKKIKRMTKVEFIRILAPLLSTVNCGHSFIHLNFEKESNELENANFLPIQIKVIDNQLFLIKDFSGNNLSPGIKIHWINNLNSEELIDKLYASLPSDGEIQSSKEHVLNRNMRFNYLYSFLVDSSENFKIKYSTKDDSSLKEVILKSINYDTLVSNYNQTPYKYVYYDKVSYDFNDDYALLTIPHFNYYDTNDFEVYRQELSMFFLELKQRDIDNLVLNLRGNGGGDPFAGKLLLTYLLEQPFQYFTDNSAFHDDLKNESLIDENSFKGHLYTLIDGGCFSTTGHVISLLKYHNRGIFIGQESGAGYMCSDNSKLDFLINTGIRFNLAKISYSANVTGQVPGRGIIPDYIINYTINDYINKKDLEMNYAVSLINNSI